MKDFFIAGMRNIRYHICKMLFPILYVATVCTLWSINKSRIPQFALFSIPHLYLWGFNVLTAISIVFGVLAIIMLFGLQLLKEEHKLIDIDFGKNKPAPKLLSISRQDGVTKYELFSSKIPLSRYKENQEDIETALNMYVSIRQGKDKQHTVITGVSAKKGVPTMIEWNNTYLKNEDFVFNLGICLSDKENVLLNIDHTPHILCGGSSGSGKSKILQLMLFQAIQKSAIVKLVDLKGGLDYASANWKEKCEIITTPQAMDDLLKEVLIEMENRRSLLVKAQTPNIHEYNQKADKKLQRIIIACDEIGECLDKSGLGKQDAEMLAIINSIERSLSTIGRQGRAFGIHLILCTQRPSAEIIKGEIKANLGYKIAGRCDKVLSQIILDNSDGAEQISPDSKGLFLTNGGKLFQAYYLSDDCFDVDNNKECSDISAK